MWFIQLDDDPTSIGMVSLALYEPSDTTLADGADRTEVSALFIYPEYRKKGYGEQAILKVEAIAKEMGKKFTTMNTSAAGPNMSRYSKLGYVEYRERERKYPLHEILACGWTEEHCFAAFLEKNL